MLEDKILKQPGLYGMWSILYLANIITLCTDSVQGPVRDFNLYTSLLSHIYTSVSGANVIYGNKKPSSLLMIAGPLHQYTFWMLLAYYRGNVYGSSPVGVINVIHTVVVAIFTLDMVVKTWLLSINPNSYLDYVNEVNDEIKSDRVQHVGSLSDRENNFELVESKDISKDNLEEEKEDVPVNQELEVKKVSETLVNEVIKEAVNEV